MKPGQPTPPVHPAELMAPLDLSGLVPDALMTPGPQRLIEGARSHLGLVYADPPGWRPLRLDLHLPLDGPGPWPVVVYVHGGSFLVGVPGMGPWHSLPGRGIAVASISYRLAGEAPFPEPVEDVRAAVRWVREQASQLALDDTRIALWGSSAGAFLASTAAVLGDRPIGRPIGQSDASSTVSAVVDHYGITDVRTLAADADPHASADLPGLLRAMGYFVRQEGGPTPAILDHVGTSAPPFLIMHGDVDRRVGVDQSRRLHSGLREAGVSSQLVIVPGADHGDPLFEHEMHIDTVVRFLREVWAPEAGT